MLRLNTKSALGLSINWYVLEFIEFQKGRTLRRDKHSHLVFKNSNKYYS